MNKHQVDWVKCIDVCSDGDAAMVGKIKGTVTKIKNVTVVIAFYIATLLLVRKCH